MAASLHIVIVNWNTGPYLRACLASIVGAQDGVVVDRVTVVDNASRDGSAEDLPGAPASLEVIRNARNAGFAAACNQGAAQTRADYLLFLNPDTRVPPGTLGRAAAFMDSEAAADVGICGVTIVDERGSPAISAARFPSLRVLAGKMTGLDRVLPRWFPSHHLPPGELGASRYVDQVIGAFFLVRAPLFRRLGGFDERYFIYFEEVDFALRALRTGARSYFLKDATIVHAENVSSDQVPDVRLYHSLRSRLLFAYRHWPRWQAHLLLLLTMTVEPVARAVRAALAGDRAQLRSTASAYRRLITAGRR